MLPWDGLAAEISGSAPKRAKPILVRLARVTGIALGGFYWVLLEAHIFLSDFMGLNFGILNISLFFWLRIFVCLCPFHGFGAGLSDLALRFQGS